MKPAAMALFTLALNASAQTTAPASTPPIPKVQTVTQLRGHVVGPSGAPVPKGQIKQLVAVFQDMEMPVRLNESTGEFSFTLPTREDMARLKTGWEDFPNQAAPHCRGGFIFQGAKRYQLLLSFAITDPKNGGLVTRTNLTETVRNGYMYMYVTEDARATGTATCLFTTSPKIRIIRYDLTLNKGWNPVLLQTLFRGDTTEFIWKNDTAGDKVPWTIVPLPAQPGQR